MQDLADMITRFETYIREKFPQREQLNVTEFNRVMGGTSSMSYLVTMAWQENEGPVSETLVIRMLPEMGPLPPYDIKPQYEALNAVYGKGIPVPKVHWLELDKAVMGHEFFAMERIEGEIMLALGGCEPELLAQPKKDFIDNLATLHAMDWRSLDLRVLQPPADDRQHARMQIERWERVMDSNQYTPQPLMTEAFIWLKRNIPAAERTALIHGDYSPHNMFCHDGRIVAIFDWELTALGDPIRDVAYACMMNEVMRLGFWDDAEFIRAYEKTAGVVVSADSFFFWKLLGHMLLASAGLAAVRTGLESKHLEVNQLGVYSVLMRRIFKAISEMLGF